MSFDIKVIKSTISSSEITVTCPAQGFPVPITRFVVYIFVSCGIRFCSMWILFIEPTSNTRPKLPTNRKVEWVEVLSSKSTNLMCPLQGYPVPISRWEKRPTLNVYVLNVFSLEWESY